MLLDYNHGRNLQFGHVGAEMGIKLSSIVYAFETGVGDLIVYVRPEEDADDGIPDRIQRILIMNERGSWPLEKTTRPARAQARKAGQTPDAK